MGIEGNHTYSKSGNMDKLSTPPGFVSQTTFVLRNVHQDRDSSRSMTPGQEQITGFGMDDASFKLSLNSRPWIVHDDHTNPNSESLKPIKPEVRERRIQRVSKNVALEEAPVFNPTEEEFSDTLSYIASLRDKAEPYGICCVVPPPSWKPPCLLEDKEVWEASKFDTQVQLFDAANDATIKKEADDDDDDDDEDHTSEENVKFCRVERGPRKTLETFKNFADSYKKRHFSVEDEVLGSKSSSTPSLKQEPTVADVEKEYRQLVESPLVEIEVLYGNDLDTRTFSSGFPLPGASESCKYKTSGWNLNNTAKLPGSLLSYEDCESVGVPRLSVGMFLSSQLWKSEKDRLYSLCYLHMGAPRVWYSVAGCHRSKVMNLFPEMSGELQSKISREPVMIMSPYALNMEGIPVTRCVQNPGQYVILFPGSCYSAVNCGFNCLEKANFAPIDWLPHGDVAVHQNQEKKKKSLISYDKILLGAAREAVKHLKEYSLSKKKTADNMRWLNACGREGLFTSIVKSRVKLERIEPQQRSTDSRSSHHAAVNEVKASSVNPKKSSPKAKISTRENSLFGGDPDITEKPIEPINVYSEKELIREFEKIASTLVPEKDWSMRISAMRRVEGLVAGGATDYSCFRGLLKQLIGPLSTQLSDRRSTIVKQACHLLCLLSKELLGDFESCAEIFIPVLFKLVVITVLVIAESADNCIKTMLRNCKAARVLPRIAEAAKHDRNAVLRARCCEYALLTLEHWPDAPEIQRSVDLYEDLIRCCVADAMSEVRATARMCYRLFAKTWPDRSRRLFSSFDPVIQRLINEEEGGSHRRHASPSVRERHSQPSFSQTFAPSNLPGYGTSAIVAMDRSSNLSSGGSLSSGLLLSQSKDLNKGSERSLESVLQSSKQKVSAIESMLRGLHVSDRQNPAALRSSSLDLGVDPPSSRDPPFRASVPASNTLTNKTTAESMPSINRVSNRSGGLGLSDIITQIQASKDSGRQTHRSNMLSESHPSFSSLTAKRVSERNERSSFEDNNDARRFMVGHLDRQQMDNAYRDSTFRDSNASHVPNFQRPLLRKNVGGRLSAGRTRSFDDSQLQVGDMSNYVDGPASLNEALNDGLNSSSDWCARVAAFNFLQTLLQQGAKGAQEVIQNFEKVMKLFLRHLDDPHHKVAQAALSTLADLIPSCRKPFESYMERVLPHVFSRLIDPKEVVRQPCSSTLDIVSKTYSVDSLLPALLRSLDEQRSPKAKLAVIEFAINSFNRYAGNPEISGNSGILKLWLAKLTPLTRDKNTKLKEASITCIISVYNHYDSAGLLNYILSLSVEEQNSLRRALKQYTPRIEVDLLNYMQSKKEKLRVKSYDPSDAIGTSSEEGYPGASKKNIFLGRYSGGSVDSDSGRKWSSSQEPTTVTGGGVGQSVYSGTQEKLYHNFRSGISSASDGLNQKDSDYTFTSAGQNLISRTSPNGSSDKVENFDNVSPPHLEKNGLNMTNADSLEERHENEASRELDLSQYMLSSIKVSPTPESGPSIPQILHMINATDGSPSSSKISGLQQLIEASVANEESVWTKYFNQILTVVLEVVDDEDLSVREVALSLISEMLKSQKDAMEDSVEIVIEKLLHVSKESIPKVSSEAEQCLTTVLSQYDPFRCLSVIVPQLVTEDEKTLVACINCLTKLVGRLSQEELMDQLSSFLPAVFEAFGNQSADVRKTVVFCLVDIYIMLGKAFLPYLEGLNSTQVRLVTIYANRISQARTGAPIDPDT